MRILANVNVPRSTVEALRLAGHDVAWALERMATDTDFKILAAAQIDARIVLTNDKDFGELAVRSGLPARCGVILLRLKGLSPDEAVARTVEDRRTKRLGRQFRGRESSSDSYAAIAQKRKAVIACGAVVQLLRN